MSEDTLQRLLLDCGFRKLLWTPLRGQRWAVVGEVEGGLEITVACTAGPVLHVPSETACELLDDMLAQNGAPAVHIVADALARRETPSWIPLAIGAGAVALFGWIFSTLR
jgi:hypothetical protein